MMTYGLIGERLPHSFSKEIHERIGRYNYSLIELKKDELADFILQKNYKGLNVTIPYKQAVIPLLDEVDPAAAEIGAVNTIVNRDGRLVGYNTDYLGMRALIGHIGADLKGKKALILGTGGTSKTAAAAAQSLGARQVQRVSRTAREGAITYEDAYRLHADAEVIINTTPCGMFPDIGGCPIEIERFLRLEAVIDAVYNPLSTVLADTARRRGLIASGGLYMLVAQAVCAAELFLGERLGAEELTDRIFCEIEQQKRNIVLIGMPGSGKSAVGRALSRMLSRELIDTDAMIVEKERREISEIFAVDGEAYFRDRESEAVREAAARSGVIISTGGGAILREENVQMLRLNGSIFFIDRPLEQLIPTDDRPLADKKEKIEALYHERLPLYRAAANCTVTGGIGVENVARNILESRTKL